MLQSTIWLRTGFDLISVSFFCREIEELMQLVYWEFMYGKFSPKCSTYFRTLTYNTFSRWLEN